MYKYCEIIDVHGREVLDSRGNPTVEAEVIIDGGYCGSACVPSGASTGRFEAVELRDDKKRYNGKGVEKAVLNVNMELAESIIHENALNQFQIDRMLIEADGTSNKEHLGANAVLGVSMAVAHAAAKVMDIPLYRYLGGVSARRLPVPMMNIINGGAHSDNSIDCQEFMILPMGASCFREGLRWCAEVYQVLKELLKKNGMSVSVGDEGGFAPNLSGEEEALEYIIKAIESAGYTAGRGKDFMISLDVAASEWKSDVKGRYVLPKQNTTFETDELIEIWSNMCDKYPIFSIEDPLDEEDWDGWKKITQKLGSKIRLVGDDLFVTNTKRLKKGIKEKSGNAILIKPNQIGTVMETFKAVQMAQRHGFIGIMSHRSGETEDTTIADMAVALNTGYIKTGAPCRGERTAKYNRLLRIEEELGDMAVYGTGK